MAQLDIDLQGDSGFTEYVWFFVLLESNYFSAVYFMIVLIKHGVSVGKKKIETKTRTKYCHFKR